MKLWEWEHARISLLKQQTNAAKTNKTSFISIITDFMVQTVFLEKWQWSTIEFKIQRIELT